MLAGCSSSTRPSSRSTSARCGAPRSCCSRRRPRCSSTRRGSCAPSTPRCPRPVVIRLVTFVKVPRDTHRRKITRRAVFARDGWACQYCGSRSNLTVDHVIPRSKGGPSSWENIVASCAPCNRRKGDHLPDQAGMHPRRAARPRRARTCSSTSPARRSRRPGDSGCPRRAPWPTRPEWTGRRPSRRRCAALGAGGGRRARGRRAAARAASGWPTTCSCWPTAASSCCAAGRARAGSVDDPDLTAAREALVLERLADTPVPAPELVAADPDAAACDVPALLITRVPGRADRRAARRSGRSPRALAEIHAVDPDRHPALPPLLRARAPGGADMGRRPRRVGARDRAGPRAAARAARALHPPRLPSGQHAVGGRRAHRRRRLDDRLARARRRSTSATCAGTSRSTTASASPTPSSPTPSTIPYYDVVTALDVLPELDATVTHAELLRLEEHVPRARARCARRSDRARTHEGRPVGRPSRDQPDWIKDRTAIDTAPGGPVPACRPTVARVGFATRLQPPT